MASGRTRQVCLGPGSRRLAVCPVVALVGLLQPAELHATRPGDVRAGMCLNSFTKTLLNLY